MKKIVITVVVLAVAAWLYNALSGGDLKQQAMIEAASVAGNLATDMLDRADSERANQLHNVPITLE